MNKVESPKSETGFTSKFVVIQVDIKILRLVLHSVSSDRCMVMLLVLYGRQYCMLDNLVAFHVLTLSSYPWLHSH